MRDILKGDAQALAVAQVIAQVRPDVILLQDLDYDAQLLAAGALRDRVAEAGHFMPHLFAFAPNSGVPSGIDLDGDGRTTGPGDAHGFGRYAGQGGMVLLSRYPITSSQDFSGQSWGSLDWVNRSQIARAWGANWSEMRLASVGHWQVTVDLPGGGVDLLVFHATPPVFDGPEDRNGLRNRDQLLFWAHRLDRAGARVVLLGDANNDPDTGEGRSEAISALLGHTRLQDPLPGQPTVHWDEQGLAPMRVDYVLPARELQVVSAGVVRDPPAEIASRHQLVWVDIAR
ncbi:endonuclease/exonuclease/phosphatase family protein [Thalassovita sp.]|uniref:endonuclease/exonuclease/phosphatase family protein n=1 Tax=Thalassovita sp. TaxID=1979401 RepID=UPI0029DE718B|nr:endonuclease/exonuclease/phosphatase family protein [Thalassovita sp.]